MRKIALIAATSILTGGVVTGQDSEPDPFGPATTDTPAPAASEPDPFGGPAPAPAAAAPASSEPDPFGPATTAPAPATTPAPAPAPVATAPAPAAPAGMSAAEILKNASQAGAERRMEVQSLEITTTGSVMTNRQLRESESQRALAEARKMKELKQSAGVYRPPVLYNAEQYLAYNRPPPMPPQPKPEVQYRQPQTYQTAEVPAFQAAAPEMPKKRFSLFNRRNSPPPAPANPYTYPEGESADAPVPEFVETTASMPETAAVEAPTEKRRLINMNWMKRKPSAPAAPENPYSMDSPAAPVVEAADVPPPAPEFVTSAPTPPESSVLSVPAGTSVDMPAEEIAAPQKKGLFSGFRRKTPAQPEVPVIPEPTVVADVPAMPAAPTAPVVNEPVPAPPAGPVPTVAFTPSEPTVAVKPIGSSNYRVVNKPTSVVVNGQPVSISAGTHLRVLQPGEKTTTVQLHDDRTVEVPTKRLDSVPLQSR